MYPHPQLNSYLQGFGENLPKKVLNGAVDQGKLIIKKKSNYKWLFKISHLLSHFLNLNHFRAGSSTFSYVWERRHSRGIQIADNAPATPRQ